MISQKLTKEDDGILSEIAEIGCMCIKCNCEKIVPLVVSICEPCLKDKHEVKLYTILNESQQQ